MTPDEAAQLQSAASVSPKELPMEFDFGFGIPGPPNITGPLSLVRDGTAGLMQKLNQHTLERTANIAVGTDQLSSKLGSGLAAQVNRIELAKNDLQQKLTGSMFGKVSEVVAGGLALGAMPPDPTGDTPTPLSVGIRTAAENGDIGPALQFYRQSVYPYSFAKGTEYVNGMRYVQRSLPQDDKTQSAFASGVTAINSNPFAADFPIGDPGNAASAAQCAAERAELERQQDFACTQAFPGDTQAIGDCIAQVHEQIMAMPPCTPGVASGGIGGAGVGGPGRPPNPYGPGGGGGIIKPGPGGGGIVKPGPGGPGGGGGLPGVPGGPVPSPPPTQPPGSPGGPPRPGPGNPPGGGGQNPPGNPPGIPTQPPGNPPTTPPTGPQPPITPGPVQPSPPGAGSGTAPPAGSGPGGVISPGGTCDPGFGIPCGPTPPAPTPPGGNPPPTKPPPTTQGGCPGFNGQLVSPIDIIERISHDDVYGLTPEQVVDDLQNTYGVSAYLSGLDKQCDSGYVEFQTVNGMARVPPVKVCVKCPGQVAPPPTQTNPPGCCNVVVNVPTCQPGTTGGGTTPTQPPPPPPPPGAPFNPQPVPVNIDGCAEFGRVPGLQLPEGFKDFSKIIGVRKADGSINTDWLGTGYNPISQALATAISGFVAQSVDNLAKIAESILTQSGCANGQQIALIGSSLILNFIRNFVGDSFDSLRVPNQQQRNFLCPTQLPDADSAGRAWLANAIDEKTLECWVRACGVRYPEFKTTLDGQRTKLSPGQVGMLYMRDFLTRAQYDDRVRELGFTKGTDPQDILDLLKQIPPPTDLVRMMVRDTADELLVAKFGMDEDFKVKYAGDIEKWSKQQGITEEYMRHVWRAHWSIPPAGQLFQMLHRSWRYQPGDPRYVDESIVETALKQQDILPYWIPKLKAIAYAPLTRIDAQRAYRIGVLNETQLKGAYLDIGYDDSNAQILVDFVKAQVVKGLRNHPAIRQFANGELSQDQMLQILIADGATPELADDIYKRAVTLRQAGFRKKCIASIRKQYLLGDIDAADAQSLMTGYGVDGETATALTSGWQCERAARGKSIPAGQLCDLYASGAFDMAELVRRLQRIGYTYEDSVMIARRCKQRSDATATAKELQDVRRQEAEARRIAREEYTAANRAAQKAQKLARGIESMRRINVAREKRLLEAGGGFAKNSGGTLGDSIVFVKALYNSLLRTSVYQPDEIIQALVVAGQSPSIVDRDGLISAVNTALAAVATG